MKIPRKTGRWILLLGVGTFLYFSFMGNDGLLTLFKTSKTIDALSEDISQYHQSIDSLQTTIRLLKNDSAYLERMAREKLGMARQGEKVIKFIEE